MNNAIKTIVVLFSAATLVVGCGLVLKERRAQMYEVPYEQQEECTCVRIEPQ